MIKKLKRLFSRNDVGTDSPPLVKDFGFYLKDKNDQVHYVTLDIIRTEEGLLEIEYASSSDLEARGLEPYIEEVVMKIMGGEGVE